MKISKRIREIEKLIPDGSIVADIGCDHAYLDCLAVKHQKAIKCYACDVHQGPLENAKKTIFEMQCQDYVFPILSNGLENVPEDADVCVISGMGYETMKMILEKGNLEQFKTLILQANCDVNLLRRWLISHQFKIVNEKTIKEGHYYTIVVCCHGFDQYSEIDYMFGKFGHDDVFREYWNFRKIRIDEIIPQLTNKIQKEEFEALSQMIQHKIDA